MTLYDPIITINDIRLAGHCPAGAKTWFSDNGLSFKDFLNDGGWPASRLMQVRDNGLVVQVVERKRARDHG